MLRLTWRWAGKPLLWLFFALFVGALIYCLSALCFGLLPVNRDFSAPKLGEPTIEFFLRNNGIHTDFVLPLDDPLARQIVDWRRQHPGSHFGTPRKPPKTPIPLVLDEKLDPSTNPQATHIAIGWGDQGFYLETPEWADLTASVALRALTGIGKSALHVEYERTPNPALPSMRRITVSPATYAKLAQSIQAEFARDSQGGLRLIARRGYTVHDAFYEARSSFSLVTTCNEWVRAQLSNAGIRTAAWAPFHFAIYRHLQP